MFYGWMKCADEATVRLPFLSTVADVQERGIVCLGDRVVSHTLECVENVADTFVQTSVQKPILTLESQRCDVQTREGSF
jgi:hypothetical protein